MADKPDEEAIKAAVDVLSKVDPAKLQQLGLNAQATGAQATSAQATGAQALTKEFLEAIQLLTVGKDRELLIKRFGDEADLARRYERVKRLMKESEENPDEFVELQKWFLSRAKNKQCTETEVIVATYTLYAIDNSRYMLFKFMQIPESDVIHLHNVYVAMHTGQREKFLEDNSKLLVDLPWPLFPPTEEFTTLNLRLLTDWRDWKAANATPVGGEPTHPPPRHNANLFADKSSTTGGEPFLPIGEITPGQWAADARQVAEAMHDQHRRIDALTKSVEKLSRGNGAGFRGQGRGQGQSRGRGRASSDGYRGQSQGRGGYRVRGGQTDEADDMPMTPPPAAATTHTASTNAAHPNPHACAPKSNATRDF
uniref:Uncharacterized protein n=1 Tax=Neobodo designis TaxID=312471 RepID=A0A7S1LS05_NEODS|mmetsp:Transcript_27192/g.84250  ORF Transcript_27192/g.84250 Transcript_27192/m.84250 type:complete len:368 (+) Transcript_27192:119-1222(+)